MKTKHNLRIQTLDKRKAQDKMKKCSTQLYIFQLDNDKYKIGCSDNIEKRLKAGKTWSASIQKVISRKIPPMKSSKWRFYEKKIQDKFSERRVKHGGTEIFNFNKETVCQAVNFLKNMRF